MVPLTESAAYDLVIDIKDTLKRVQVRFSSTREVGLRKIHSNSKGYVVKILRKNAFDWLYVLNAEGHEFLITRDVSGMKTVTPQTKDRIETVFPKL